MVINICLPYLYKDPLQRLCYTRADAKALMYGSLTSGPDKALAACRIAQMPNENAN